MKKYLLTAFCFFLIINVNAQKFKEFKFQIVNNTNSAFNIIYETYDLKPLGQGTFLPINNNIDEKTISLDKKKKYVRFSGRSKGSNVHPVVFEVESLKKFKHGTNPVYLIIEETAKGTNIDLGNLVSNITNEHYYKLLTYNETERFGEDEVTSIGTIVIVDSSNVLELNNVGLKSDKQNELIRNEYSKEETYFVDKTSIQEYAVDLSTPRFAFNVDVSLIDSGLVEFKFKIDKVQHYIWNGISPYDYLKTENGTSLINGIYDLIKTGEISEDAQVYFISSYVKINNLVTTQRSFDKKGRDIHGKVSLNLSNNFGIAARAKNVYQIRSGFVKVDSVITAGIMTSGKNISPLVASLITIEDASQRLDYLNNKNEKLEGTIIELYNNIRVFKNDTTLKETDNIRVIKSNTAIYTPISVTYNIEIPDSITLESSQNIVKIETERIARFNQNLEDLNTEMNKYFSNIKQIDIIEKDLSGIKKDEHGIRDFSNQDVDLSFLDNKKIKRIQ